MAYITILRLSVKFYSHMIIIYNIDLSLRSQPARNVFTVLTTVYRHSSINFKYFVFTFTVMT
jgi:hypothetical protein